MYQALYRVWRPQRFESVVGQDAIVRTLKNAIKSDKVSHAYLFTGPRGTGKTSAAKIFAKALNCPNQVDGEPCDACPICDAIRVGSLSDVIEIDAASNNGVEEIRDIRDKSRYAPTEATYKIYIIDEVHMLSTGAFNALLKTLEEPTQNVIFILATTEPHKIPATILSRTQRFDFKRISDKEIETRLAYILEQEKIVYEAESLTLLARTAKGGMRDALSLLDQAISYSDDSITIQNVLQVSGGIAQEHLLRYTQELAGGQAQEALESLHHILAEGKEAGRLVEELLLFSRDLLILNQIGQSSQLLASTNQLSPNTIASDFVYRFIGELTKTQEALRFTTQREVYLEVLTLKMANGKPKETADNADLAQLQAEITSLKERLAKAPESSEVPKESRPTLNAQRKTDEPFTPNLSRIFEVLASATAEDRQKIQEEWPDIVSCLETSARAKLNASTVLAASPKGVVLGFEYDILCSMTESDAKLKEEISQHAMRLIQHPCHIECVPHNQWKEVRDKFIQAKKMGHLDQYVQTPDSSPTQESEADIIQAVESAVQITPLEQEMLEKSKETAPIVDQAQALFGGLVEIVEE